MLQQLQEDGAPEHTELEPEKSKPEVQCCRNWCLLLYVNIYVGLVPRVRRQYKKQQKILCLQGTVVCWAGLDTGRWS